MFDQAKSTTVYDGFLAAVRSLLQRRFSAAVPTEWTQGCLAPGKMLRSRLAGRLVEAGLAEHHHQRVQALCAAAEIVHTASLCHDDVIDNAHTRRGKPALWRSTSATGAILIGDLLLCESLELLLEIEGGRHTANFLAKVRQVIEAETAQELFFRGQGPGINQCKDVARGKTGPLFALVASACGSEDAALSAVLEQAGYCIGTAYQLADDLLDAVGNEKSSGKTLGSDNKRNKCTIARLLAGDHEAAANMINSECAEAIACLGDYPQAQAAVKNYLARDLQPVFDAHFDFRMELAV